MSKHKVADVYTTNYFVLKSKEGYIDNDNEVYFDQEAYELIGVLDNLADAEETVDDEIEQLGTYDDESVVQFIIASADRFTSVTLPRKKTVKIVDMNGHVLDTEERD